MRNLEGENLKDKDTIMSDSEEDSYEEIIQQMDSVLSPRLKLENDYCKIQKFPYNKTIAQRTVDDYTKFPDYVKENKEMDIKDVMKEHVLPFLPAKSLCRFRTVCKEWDKWIVSPFLQHKQTNYFRDISGLFCQFPGDKPSFISLNPPAYGIPSACLSFLPEEVEIRTTCNGLLCCQQCHGDNTYYICNPANKEWKVLPKPNFYHGAEPAMVLVFEPSTFNFVADYELVCAFHLADLPVISFEIYSSRTESWRQSNTLCCELNCLKLDNNGFYARGFVYWQTDSGTVLAFNVKEEQYEILSLPQCSGAHGALAEMRGELCYILAHKQFMGYTINIYGVLSTSLKFTISLDADCLDWIHWESSPQCRALACVNDEKLILLLEGRLIAYHVGSKKIEHLNQEMNYEFSRYLPYVNSLVSVNPPSN